MGGGPNTRLTVKKSFFGEKASDAMALAAEEMNLGKPMFDEIVHSEINVRPSTDDEFQDGYEATLWIEGYLL